MSKTRRLIITDSINAKLQQDMNQTLCEHILTEISKICDEHNNPLDCPDSIIIYSLEFREFGIPIRDGEDSTASSSILINNCPWCGAKLPKELRKEWFQELEKLGFDDPLFQNIPKEFKSTEWWKKRNL